MQAASILVEDLSAPPRAATPQARREHQELRIAVSRGLDIVALAARWWPVCSGCDLMCCTREDRLSACCRSAVRVQGWSL